MAALSVHCTPPILKKTDFLFSIHILLQGESEASIQAVSSIDTV